MSIFGDAVDFFKENETAQTIGANVLGGPFAGPAAALLTNDTTREWMAENPDIVGTGVGAGLGMAFGNPMMGAKIGGSAGSMAGQQFGGMGQSRKRSDNPARDLLASKRRSASPRGYGGNSGGYTLSKGGALKLSGRGHEKGGIRLSGNKEVEAGETVGRAKGGTHAFSKRLKVPGTDMTFADMHQQLVNRGASQDKINQLADLQAQVANDQKGSSERFQTGGQIDPDPPYGAEESQFPYMDMFPFDPNFGMNQDGSFITPGPSSINSETEFATPGMMEGVTVSAEGPNIPGSQADGPLARRLIGPGRSIYNTLAGRTPMNFDEGNTSSSESGSEGAGPSSTQSPNTEYIFPLRSLEGAGPTFNDPTVPAAPMAFNGETMPGVPESDASGAASSGTTTESTSGEGSGFDFGNAADSVLPYIPGAINAARGALEDAEGMNIPTMSIAERSVNAARRMDTDVDVEPQLASAEQAFRSVVANPNASQAQKQAAFSNLMQRRSKIQSTEENKETQLENQKQSTISKLLGRIDRAEATANQEAATREAKSKRRAEAAKQNLLTSGISQLVGARSRQKRQDMAMNRSVMSVLASMAGAPDTVKEDVLKSIMPLIQNERVRNSLESSISSK